MSNFSLDYCIDEFMIYCRSRDLRRRTLDSYEHTLRLFERWCKVEMKIDRILDVSEQVIRRYITNLQERGKYTFYADENSRSTNFPERRRDYRQPITTATISNYISRRQISIRADIAKGVRDRSVFFSLKTERVLRNWLQYKDRYIETDYLFPTKKNKMPVNLSSFESNFKGYLRRAKIEKDVTPHCLRNNFAKRCLMNGMDIYTLSRLLGHSSVTVTEEAYLDLTDNDIGQRYQHFSPVNSM